MRRKGDKTIKILGVIYLAVMIIIILCTVAEAKETKATVEKEFQDKSLAREGEYRSGGNLFIYKRGRLQVGWVRYKGHTYYCHKTGSAKYPVGSATRGEMRVRKGKFFAFQGTTGRLITEDYYIRKGRFKRRLSLKINRDRSVRYVYNTSACFGSRRYSTKERRYQEEQMNGKWKTVGMQFWPDYIDWQE